MEDKPPKRHRGRPVTGHAKPRTVVAINYRSKKKEQGLAYLATWVPAALADKLKAKANEENVTIGHIIDRYLKIPDK